MTPPVARDWANLASSETAGIEWTREALLVLSRGFEQIAAFRAAPALSVQKVGFSGQAIPHIYFDIRLQVREASSGVLEISLREIELVARIEKEREVPAWPGDRENT